MPPKAFNNLCKQIANKIGEDKFRSEAWLQSNKKKIKTADALEPTGGLIPGEIKENSGGASYGTFGAIDGLAIQMKCPSGVADPVNYYCRKGFYALNVQAICDR